MYYERTIRSVIKKINESFPVLIGTGTVICMPADLLPAEKKNWYVAAWLI